ncbi:MAG: hypothetical protein IJ272_09825 [Clostridia bacterium]|nr:hypothetical protein [Clostridia bacterium]
MFEAFKCGLSIDEIKLLINPEFSLEQVRELRKGFNFKLSVEQIRPIANPEIPSKEMAIKINQILKAAQISQLKKDFSRFYGWY